MRMTTYYSPDYNATAVDFETTRKADALVASLTTTPIPGVALIDPEPATLPELERAHDRAYLSALQLGIPERRATSNGLGWDPHLFRAVSASTGGVLRAAARVRTFDHQRVAGSLSSGLHHARWDEGLGFCTLNGLAAAALDAQANRNAKRILILDLDAHCGGGTADIVGPYDGIEQLDISVIPFDHYRSTENLQLHVVDKAADYLPTIQEQLAAIPHPETIDLVLYNAGMDPHEQAGGIDGITAAILADREDLVFRWAADLRLPIAWVLAGGYTGPDFTLDDVVNLHRLTLEAAVRYDVPSLV
jgi:acetoin utilization deacetylase AcuC-like enzyme